MAERRFIDANNLTEEIREERCYNCRNFKDMKCDYCGTADYIYMIEDMPAADVAPVRHGKWIFGKDLPYSWGQIPKNKYHLYCSECLEQAFNRSEDNDPDFDADTLYCPFCGCRMDGGAD